MTIGGAPLKGSFDPKVLAKLKEKYSHLHPLLFFRSMERAKTNGDLFDILDTVASLPVVWCDRTSRWIHVEDIYFKKDFLQEQI